MFPLFAVVARSCQRVAAAAATTFCQQQHAVLARGATLSVLRRAVHTWCPRASPSMSLSLSRCTPGAATMMQLRTLASHKNDRGFKHKKDKAKDARGEGAKGGKDAGEEEEEEEAGDAGPKLSEMTIEEQLEYHSEKMDQINKYTISHLGRLRAGKVAPDMLDDVKVDTQGQRYPLRALAQIGIRDTSTLIVTPFGSNEALNDILAAIRDCGLGFNPQMDGRSIRVSVPKVDQKGREDLVKKAGLIVETGKVKIRAVRKTMMDSLKNSEKEKSITKDERRDYEKTLQDEIDSHNAELAKALEAKTKDLLNS
eukprot:gnl/Spiro4/8475_TR4448_c0_g1_i1.p1 gnl/Spiro4/8475_TR4448_c0_g1~~gnl/Spiro4/8475_TR4448_c0_g1_i1.p1  ORF type:complete len:334 (+),score=59.55 gnl/Spiro4/8475_TR4448_c0_g1_i1:71-1003(+)